MTIFRNLFGHVVLVGLLALPSVAQATNRECRVKPTMVITDRSGGVHISGNVGATGNLYWQNICSVNGVQNNVSVDVCRNWFSAAIAAQASSKTIYIIYNDTENNGVVDCVNFPAWTQPRIIYLGPEG